MSTITVSSCLSAILRTDNRLRGDCVSSTIRQATAQFYSLLKIVQRQECGELRSPRRQALNVGLGGRFLLQSLRWMTARLRNLPHGHRDDEWLLWVGKSWSVDRDVAVKCDKNQWSNWRNFASVDCACFARRDFGSERHFRTTGKKCIRGWPPARDARRGGRGSPRRPAGASFSDRLCY